MFVDKNLLLSDSQAVTAAAASTNTIDLSEVRDIGSGRPLYVVVVVEVAFTDASSNSTLTVTLEGDSSDSFSPDGTQDLFTIPALAAAGNKYFASLDPGAAPLQYRYIRLKYTPNNGDLSTGTLSAFITMDIGKYLAYADNITVS